MLYLSTPKFDSFINSDEPELKSGFALADKDETVTRLEEQIAHLTLANEELSGEVLAQWKRIEALEKHLVQLENKLIAYQDAQEEMPANAKPPHW